MDRENKRMIDSNSGSLWQFKVSSYSQLQIERTNFVSKTALKLSKIALLFMWQTVRQDFFPAVSNLCRPQQFQLRETEHIPKHTHTHTRIREELRFLSWLIYPLAVHQLSRPGDDIMCDISPWRCYLSVLFQPRLNPPPSRHNSIRTYRDLPPQSQPLPKCSSGRPARGAGMAICVGPVAMYSRWRFQDAACHADISWLLRTFKEPDKITK